MPKLICLLGRNGPFLRSLHQNCLEEGVHTEVVLSLLLYHIDKKVLVSLAGLAPSYSTKEVLQHIADWNGSLTKWLGSISSTCRNGESRSYLKIENAPRGVENDFAYGNLWRQAVSSQPGTNQPVRFAFFHHFPVFGMMSTRNIVRPFHFTFNSTGPFQGCVPFHLYEILCLKLRGPMSKSQRDDQKMKKLLLLLLLVVFCFHLVSRFARNIQH